ncbi:SAM-dependent methyltransferase [Actinoplanes sp. NPDC048791]|uniref:SAM-dependent methyltransferase n=1 Tax=Actinoplanes sp. NPDC048791 TaxID=3154623 RepID=UPI003400195D
MARKFIRRALAHQDARHKIAQAARLAHHDAQHEIAKAAHQDARHEIAEAAHQDASHEFAQAAPLAHQDARHKIAEAARGTNVNAPAPGSYAALTHVSGDSRPEAIGDVAASADVAKPRFPHPAAQIGGLFDGLVLVDPGPVSPTWWRPEPDLDPGEDTRRMRAGVAR